MKNDNKLIIVTQYFYGNQMMTAIDPENFDAFMLGWLNMDLYREMQDKEKIDRTVIRLPGSENLVLVYNRYKEEDRLRSLQEFIQTVRINKRDRFNPSAVIPELGIVLYSRCIACRMGEDGELLSLKEGDYEKVCKYLTA